MQLATLQLFLHNAVLKYENGTDVIAAATWNADLTALLVAPLRYLYEDS